MRHRTVFLEALGLAYRYADIGLNCVVVIIIVVIIIVIYTLNHKKRDILFLTITLANLGRFL